MRFFEHVAIEANNDGVYEDFRIIIGNADEIRAMYNTLVILADNFNEFDYSPLYMDELILINGREYGIKFNSSNKMFCILKGVTARAIIQDYNMHETKFGEPIEEQVVEC